MRILNFGRVFMMMLTKVRYYVREFMATMRSDRRYAYVVLAMFPVLLAILAVGINLVEIANNNRKFCQLIQASVTVKVPKPADPKANPSRETNYENYVIVANLGHSLGCQGIPVVK